MAENKTVITSNNAYEFASSMYFGSAESLKKQNFKFNLLASPLKAVGLICGIIPILSICIAGMWMIPKGMVDIAAFLSIFYLCKSAMPKQLHYVNLITSAIKVYPAIKRICAFWGSETYTSEVLRISEKENFNVRLVDVWYRYPQADNWTIRGISLEIPRGAKVAFCGKSGSGKSTTLKLISGLISAQTGRVCAEEAVISTQFPFLFTDSIRNNICCYDEDISGDELGRICRISGVSNFLSDFELGSSTPVLNNGNNLSGGQKQRISIARALYARSSILLFDEPCSALDAKTAELVIQNITELLPDTTVVMVLHQPELLKYFDYVYEFEEGRIVKHRKNPEMTYD